MSAGPDKFLTWVQERLNIHGAKIDPDGAFGPVSKRALRTFQQRRGLTVTGTTTPETIAALRRDPGGRDTGPVNVVVQPPWIEEGLRRLGLHEVRDRSRLMAWLRSDGRTLGDPAKQPWCGDYVETCIRLALPNEAVPANPYLARNWLDFGKPTTGRLGAVAIFWRGRRTGTSGHVAFYLRETADAVEVLGGNQANGVTRTWIKKSRLLGYRAPRTYDLDTAAVQAAVSGPLSTNEA